MEITLQRTINFVHMRCGECGIDFYVPAEWRKKKVEEKGSFSCPNGCSRVFCGDTEADKLRKQLESERNWHQSTKNDLEHEKRRRFALKGEMTKFKKRIHNGVCPCCKRHFTNLERHMKSQHPDFVAEKDGENG